MPAKAEGQLLAGRYRVLGRLGTGGMATVFLCEDERLKRKVAVKRLHAESPEDTARRFEREARLGASLNHPNLVSIFDTVTDDEGVLIVMEYVEGETLANLIDREGRVEPQRAVDILRGVAAALDHAHEQGVVHRDVKPGNVLIGRGGEVKLVDLGIATALEGPRITHSGTVLGTAAYMAPEQIDGAEPGPAADVYSLATVAFETLAGHRARVGRTPVEIARRVVMEPPPLLSDVWPEAPPEAVEVLIRGMAKNAAARPASAGELVADLERAVERAPAEPAPPLAPRTGTDPLLAQERGPSRFLHTEPSRRGRPAWLVPAALLAALAALLVGGALLLSSGDGSDGDDGGARQEAAGQSESGGEQSGGSADAPAEGEQGVPAGGSATPEATVQSFYTRSASDDFERAWELASPAFQSQLGGYDAFVAQQSSLQSIQFEKVKVKGSDEAPEVEIETVATHSDRVDECKGTLHLVRGGAGWLIDRAENIQCSRQ